MDKTESATEIEEETGNNYLQLVLYQAPKRIHDVDAARYYSNIALSLNDYAHLVSKRILPNLLGAASNNRANGFLVPCVAATICSWNFGPNSE